ncbi:MAG: fused MFS/spermidine synthase, partial [Chloroflexia bacterium]|nr:fused MFS/spermidine synthase [Chloroflexia bacterium]
MFILTDSSAPTVDQRRVSPTLIRFTVFFAGMSTVGTEISASRLVAPYFGDSTYIWANLIGITLAYLAIGYWLGGRLA